MRLLVASALCLSIGGATAQDNKAHTPLEQVLQWKLNLELDSSIACNVQVVTMQQELAIARGRIKELEAKIADNAPPSSESPK